MKKPIVFLALLLALLLLPTPVFAGAVPDAARKALDAKRAALGLSEEDGLFTALSPLAGATAGDWTAMAASFFTDESPDAYLDALYLRVSRTYLEEGTLSRDKSTEYHRILLTCLALGADPTAFGLRPDGAPVDLAADGVFFRERLDRQGVNGVIFALLSLGAYPFSAPENALHTADGLVADLLARVNPDGGWSLAGDESEPDLTAMALTALSPFLSPDAPEILSALDCLSAMQDGDGGFPLYGVSNCESAAWVVIALSSLGLDPETEPRFLKNGASPLSALLSFQDADGVFRHVRDADPDADGEMPQAQALLALAAVERFRNEGKRLFDFSEKPLRKVAPVPIHEEKPASPSPLADENTRKALVSALLAAVVLGGLGGLTAIRRKRRKEAMG